jgi:hypothetical protein
MTSLLKKQGFQLKGSWGTRMPSADVTSLSDDEVEETH